MLSFDINKSIMEKDIELSEISVKVKEIEYRRLYRKQSHLFWNSKSSALIFSISTSPQRIS